MSTRRDFIKTTAMTGAGALLYGKFGAKRAWAQFKTSPGLRKFVQPLRGVGPGGISVAVPDLTRAPKTGALHYTLSLQEFTDQLHPDLGPTRLWGYVPSRALGINGAVPPVHLGGIIVAQKGVPIQLTFRNQLPAKHILPVDTSLMGADGAANRASVHLHGGFVPWISDGGPHAWFDPLGNHGPSFLNNILNPNAALNEAEYYYPNDMTSRMLWYHDHALGTTRLNAYAGLASAFILRDKFEGVLRNVGLPDFVENGGREIPIVIQDKIFVSPNVLAADSTWDGPADYGSLWYPHEYDPTLYELEPGHSQAPPTISCVPEMFGDTMLANGTVYPEATVEARRYRLRILNACQARFLNLQLYVEEGPDGITLASPTNPIPTNAPGPDFLMIGTEGGFLHRAALVKSNVPFNPITSGGSLMLAPAERADVIVDFRGFAGKKLILYTDAPTPFPGGDSAIDFYPGNPDIPVQPEVGFGPNTRQIVRFNVVPAAGAPDPPLYIKPGTILDLGLEPFPAALGGVIINGRLRLLPGIKVRQLTLNEGFDEFGRLIQMLGTNVREPGALDFSRPYEAEATEHPRAGAVEIWQIANLTGDTHPIHFHLVNVQILARQPFDPNSYDGVPTYVGPAHGPEPFENGWKETVRMNPGEVTTVIMKFDLPRVPFAVPASPRTGGHEYVWHCHILEHEEHDMMRPLVVR